VKNPHNCHVAKKQRQGGAEEFSGDFVAYKRRGQEERTDLPEARIVADRDPVNGEQNKEES
jgi:hypothetical protein